MRIAMLAPLYESVPPKLYGGTERVVSHLTEALLELGHEVTLFASGDSLTKARLRAPCSQALRLDASCRDYQSPHVLELEMLMQEVERFDVIHFHTDGMHFPYSRRLQVPTVSTLHGRLDLPELHSLFREFAELSFVSISNSQRQPLPYLNWAGTVYHGLPNNLLRFQPQRKGDYLAFLGRISPEKGPVDAIEIAKRAGKKIKIAAKVDAADRAYFASIAPHFAQPHVEFIGEINDQEKSEFLGNALALLFPIDWPEPFGLVMIEAMATGTPVIAFPRGSVPEVIEPGVSGYVVNSVAEAVRAVERLPKISRWRCRMEFEQRFSATRMARDYVSVYQRLRVPMQRELTKAV